MSADKGLTGLCAPLLPSFLATQPGGFVFYRKELKHYLYIEKERRGPTASFFVSQTRHGPKAGNFWPYSGKCCPYRRTVLPYAEPCRGLFQTFRSRRAFRRRIMAQVFGLFCLFRRRVLNMNRVIPPLFRPAPMAPHGSKICVFSKDLT